MASKMSPLSEPRNLEVHAKWDGEIGHDVDIRVSLEIESEPGAELHLFDTRIPSVSFKHSFLWKVPQFDQGHTHSDNEPVDDGCSRYFSVDESASVKRSPKDDDDTPRSPYARDTKIPSCPLGKLFPLDLASAGKIDKSPDGVASMPPERRGGVTHTIGPLVETTCFDIDRKKVHRGRSHSERSELGDIESTRCQQPTSPRSSLTAQSLLDSPDQGANEPNTGAEGSTTILDDATAALSFASSQSSGPDPVGAISQSSGPPSPLSLPTPLKVIKREARSSDRLMRKRTAKDAGLSDSGSSSPKQPHVDIEGSLAHNEAPCPDADPSLSHVPDLTLEQIRLAKRLQHSKIPLAASIRTDRPSLIPIRTAQGGNLSVETRMSPTGLCEPSSDLPQDATNPNENRPLHEHELVQKPFSPVQDDDVFGEKKEFNPGLPAHVLSLVPPETPAEEKHEDETLDENGSKHDADTAEHEEGRIDDLSLPPSPTPSSQDIMPWSSTSVLMDLPEPETFHEEVKSLKERGCSDWSRKDPEVVLENGCLLLRNGSSVRRGVYLVTFTASIRLRPGRSGWLSLLLPQLPKTADKADGALFFDIPPNRGIEFQTTGLHSPNIIHDCFQARFMSTERLHVSFRLFDRECYTISSFDVEQEIRADSAIVKNVSRPNEYHMKVAYHALCSLQVHGVYFSAEQCSFAIHVDGGPEGQFVCELEPRPGLQVIRLDAAGEREIGVSHIEIVCAPRSLEAFGITWSVSMDGIKSSSWLPRVYPALSTSYMREGNHLRRLFTNVEAMLLSDDEDGTSGDEDEMWSSSSSKIVLYPEHISDAELTSFLCKSVISALTMPYRTVKAWKEEMMKPRSNSEGFQGLPRAGIAIMIWLLIIYCVGGFIRTQWISGNLEFSYRKLENMTAGTVLFNSQTFRDKFPNFSILDSERLREAVFGNIYKGADNVSDDETSYEGLESSVGDEGQEMNESLSNAVPTDQTGNGAPAWSSTADVTTPVSDDADLSEGYVSDAPSVSSKKASRSFRDRVDYFLGWQGRLDG